jgi:hypothetical protein
MKIRRIFLQPDEVLEVVDTEGNSVLKCRIACGKKGNLHGLVYSQPGARTQVDLPQIDLRVYLEDDPRPEDEWPEEPIFFGNEWSTDRP